MTEQELTRELASMQSRREQLERRRTEAQQLIDALSAKQGPHLVAAADGTNADARKQALKIEEEIRGERLTVAAATAGIEALDAQLVTLEAERVRAESSRLIETVERELATLEKSDSALELALGEVRKTSAAVFAAADGVAQSLCQIDPITWSTAFQANLRSELQSAIMSAFLELGRQSPSERKTFTERMQVRLRSAVAQLRYEHSAGHLEPKHGERVYRTLSAIGGLRGLNLRPGQTIALRDEEANPMLEVGAVELVVDAA